MGWFPSGGIFCAETSRIASIFRRVATTNNTEQDKGLSINVVYNRDVEADRDGAFISHLDT